jgi:beta-galactosidase/beta-glucuronidase
VLNKRHLTALMMALATAYAAVADTNYAFNGPVKLTEPMLHHLVEPRKAVNLCGDWQLAVFERPVTVNTSAGDVVYELGAFELDPDKLTWSKTVKVPYVVPGGTRPQPLYLFRKRVSLTAAEAKRQVRLVFEQVGDHAELYVNGKYVADEILTGLDWDVNISDFVREGENLIEVRIAYDVPFRKWGDYVSIQAWATGMHCGIALPVHLEICDPVYVDHAFVTTQVVPERKFRADVVLTNATDKAVVADVKVNVKDWEKPLVAKVTINAL